MATPFRSPLPDGAASLESILCTEELRRRPSPPPDYKKENHALVALSGAIYQLQGRELIHKDTRT